MGTTSIHQSPCRECDLQQPSGGVPIDLQSFFQIQFLKKHPVFATSREVKQKFLVIWEGLEPWCFLFHILFLSPPLSSYSINNAKDLVARGAMGDGFTKSPLPGAITSEGKSSQGTSCSLIGSPVAGQRSGVNNWLYRFPCDGPQEKSVATSRCGWKTSVRIHRGWNLHSVIIVSLSFIPCTTK